HESLEVDRCVLAAEMRVALARPLVARKRRALADGPIRIRSFVPTVAGPVVHEALAVPRLGDAWIQWLQSGELFARDTRRHRGKGRRSKRRTGFAARVEFKNAARTGLAAARIDRLLVSRVRI